MVSTVPRPFTVDVPSSMMMPAAKRGAQQLGEFAGHEIVEIERRVLATPGVVLPIDQGQGHVAGADKKCRPMVAHPAIVGGDVVQGYAWHIAHQLLCLGHHGFATGQNMDRLVGGERAGQFGPDRRDRLEFAGPSVGIAWPGEPGCGMPFPLGRHA